MVEHVEHKMHAPYTGLAIEMAIDFVIMYLVMYTMIATLEHFYFNINTIYMTLRMIAPDDDHHTRGHAFHVPVPPRQYSDWSDRGARVHRKLRRHAHTG